MLHALLLLVGLQLLGDMLADLASVPVPGMVVGLVLLFGVLWLRGRFRGAEHAIPTALERTARAFHENLGLLFVPAGAGIVANADGLAADGVGLIIAVLVSTPATIAVTALAAGGRRAVTPEPITTENA